MIRGSGIGEATTYSENKIKELIELCDKSSDVVGWYTNPYEKGNIRGPWNRWIDVSGDIDGTPDSVAKHSDEVYFIAAAMNHFPFVLRKLLDVQNKMYELEIEKEQFKMEGSYWFKECKELQKQIEILKGNI